MKLQIINDMQTANALSSLADTTIRLANILQAQHDEKVAVSAKAEAAAVPRSMRRDLCTCGSTLFVPGGPVVICESDGIAARPRTDGSVVTCIDCGSRWAHSPNGLRKIHEAALPAAWAQRDAQMIIKRLQEQIGILSQAGVRQNEDPRKRRMTGPNEGFALPPKD